MSSTSELVCAESRALLARLLEDDLPGDERARVERHLEGCPACTSELATARRALSTLRALPAEERARLRDDALRDMGIDETPAFSTRRARLVRLALTLLAFTLVFFFLRARRDQPLEPPRTPGSNRGETR